MAKPFISPFPFLPQPISDKTLASVGEEEDYAHSIANGCHPESCVIAETFGNGTT